ncbi:unnamed protein product, partial [Medioppia subpectinata]
DNEREVRRIKIETKRLKRKHSVGNDFIDSSSASDSSPEPSNTSNTYGDTTAITGTDITPTTSTNTSSYTTSIHTSTTNTYDNTICLDIDTYLPDTSDPTDDNLLIDNTIIDFLDLTLEPVVHRPIADYNHSFNENEFGRLNELMAATSHLQRHFIPVVTDELSHFQDCIDCMVSKIEKDIPALVRMCKSLRAFHTVCDGDQISLLKMGGLDVLLLRSIVSYDSLTNSWIIFENDSKSTRVSVDMWRNAETEGVFERHKRFISNMFSLWDGDPLVLDLLSAILMFNPNRPNLAHKETIKLQRQVYTHLLQRYLHVKYGSEDEAKTRLMQYLSNFDDIFALSRSHANSFMVRQDFSVNPFPLPLLKEICETKPSHQLTVL